MGDSWDIVKAVIEESDVIVEVLDARMPELTRNRKVESMVRDAGKPLIIVINKADMVPRKSAERCREAFDRETPCIFVSAKNRRGITLLKRKIFEIAKKRSRKLQKFRKLRKNMINVGVVGYPNTGKSSLINSLTGRRRARVGARPGWTRGLQWIRLGPGIMIIDTPGVIPMSETDEVKQALMYVLDPSKIRVPEAVAEEIIKMFARTNKHGFEKFYNIEIGDNTFEQIIEKLGKKKHMLKKGGKIDIIRVCIMIINDWQRGKLLLKSV